MSVLGESCYCEDNVYILKGSCECEEGCGCSCDMCTSCSADVDMWSIDLQEQGCDCTECTCQPKDEEWDTQP